MSETVKARLVQKAVEKPCLFDGKKECPARLAVRLDWDLPDLATRVCPICPIRLEMIEEIK